MFKYMKLLIATITLIPSLVFALPSTPPPMGQPIPSDLDAQWVVITNVKYQNQEIFPCTSKGMSTTLVCDKKGISPQDVIEKKIGQEYYPFAVSPLINYYGTETGIVLYYKRK